MLNAIYNTLVGAFLGSLVATGIVTFLAQRWIEKRERRNRRDHLRLELYLEIVDLVRDNEFALAERGLDGKIPPGELQGKRVRIFHRLKLLGSVTAKDLYDTYRQLVSQATALPIEDRPDEDEIDGARDRLVDAMAKDLQNI